MEMPLSTRTSYPKTTNGPRYPTTVDVGQTGVVVGRTGMARYLACGYPERRGLREIYNAVDVRASLALCNLA